jgi:alpha-tubulin suppressor-like RCC1 family protein
MRRAHGVALILAAGAAVVVAGAIGATLAPGASGAVSIARAHTPGIFAGRLGLAANPLAAGSAALGEVTRLADPAQRDRAAQGGISLTPSATTPHWACPQGLCEAIVDPPPVKTAARWRLPAAATTLEGSGELGGYSPADLRSAYAIPTSGGSGQTIALVEAFNYPTAEADLARYRERYGLPSCTHADGCFRRVNVHGEEDNYPTGKATGWSVESALDLEMASAACPECHLLLVEAPDEKIESLAAAVKTATSLEAAEVSNSYGLPEEICELQSATCEQYSASYESPGTIMTVASGDSGYDNYLDGAESPSFPADLPGVIAVGGTSLRRAPNLRGWSESVWSEPAKGLGSGSGCSRSEPKPVWQADEGCAHRTDNDIAAVGACETPVSIFTSAAAGGWANVCGTSAGSPLVAGIAAHAGAYARSLPGAEAIYRDPGALFDVTAGGNGGPGVAECTTAPQTEYLCLAQPGYDGPTGNGTLDGPPTVETAPPLAASEPASGVSGDSATLHAAVNPSGVATTYTFEYGTSTEYGASTPLTPLSAGSSTTYQQVSAPIEGLAANTTYHYRVLAKSASGTATGKDESFTTAVPVVVAVEPPSGPAGGLAHVRIAGLHLAGATQVMFGSVPARSFAVEGDDSISAVTPEGLGTRDVTVTTPAGRSAPTSADSYAYELGSVLGWGELGLGNGNNLEASSVPVEANGLRGVRQVVTGEGHSVALMDDGTVMAWGNGLFGQLGSGSVNNEHTPTRVCAPGVTGCAAGPYLEGVTQVAAGAFHTLALLKNGTVMAWGYNYEGQLGTGFSSGPERCPTKAGERCSRTPVPVCTVAESPCQPDHYLSDVAAVYTGALASFARLKDGTLLAWGYNGSGQLGDGSGAGPEACEEQTPCSRLPRPVCTALQSPCGPEHHLREAVEVSGGDYSTLVLLRNGAVMAIGEGGLGMLGNGVDAGSPTPLPVCAVGETAPCTRGLGEVAQISAATWHSLALLRNGTVVAWGLGRGGQLGDGSVEGPEKCQVFFSCTNRPVTVRGLGEPAVAVESSDADSYALLKSGRVAGWGFRYFSSGFGGQLGDGLAGAQEVPEPVAACAAEVPECPSGPYLEEVSAISAHDTSHVLALREGSPAVSEVWPAVANTVGGTLLTVAGSNLAGPSAVLVDGAPASVISETARSLSVKMPPHVAGAADITVTTRWGTSAPSATDQVTYKPGPVVTAIAPPRGPGAGGTKVAISGVNLTGATAVYFGGSGATRVEDISATEVRAVAPPGERSVDVTIQTPEGTSDASSGDLFTYIPRPSIRNVDAAHASPAGGAAVTISGSGFDGTSAVLFGSTPATSFLVESDERIVAVAPPFSGGNAVAEVTVISPGGASIRDSGDLFVYQPTVTRIAPECGPAVGGTLVTISGGGFGGRLEDGAGEASPFVRAVSFGRVPARSFTVDSEGELTAVSPAGGGIAPVTVTTLGGTSQASAAVAFTFAGPPCAGSTASGSGLAGNPFEGPFEASAGARQAGLRAKFALLRRPVVDPRSGAISFTLSVSQPGTLRWLLSFPQSRRHPSVLFSKGSRSIHAPGVVRFLAKPSTAAREALRAAARHGKRLEVKALIGLRSTSANDRTHHYVIPASISVPRPG